MSCTTFCFAVAVKHVLAQGEGMGFTELEVSAVDDTPPVTVLYPYGSDKNLGPAYGADYLLPVSYTHPKAANTATVAATLANDKAGLADTAALAANTAKEDAIVATGKANTCLLYTARCV